MQADAQAEHSRMHAVVAEHGRRRARHVAMRSGSGSEANQLAGRAAAQRNPDARATGAAIAVIAEDDSAGEHVAKTHRKSRGGAE
jgi:hypothetical protein